MIRKEAVKELQKLNIENENFYSLGEYSNMQINNIKRQKIIDNLFSQPNLRKYKSRYIKLNAGDAVIFHNYLFHGTLPNQNQKKIRWVYLVRFNSIKKTPYIKSSENKLTIPYTANYNLL